MRAGSSRPLPSAIRESVSDPSYTFQAVVMTYPLIGGIAARATRDYETRVPSIGGLVVRDYDGQ